MKRPQHFGSRRRSALRAGFTGITLGTTIGLVAVAILPVVALAIIAIGGGLWLAVKARADTDANYAFAKAEHH